MAERRMFSKKITESDAFLSMPLSSQCLYFHLSMNADDDGFVNNPKRICKMLGANEDDAKLLIAKRFVIEFDSGIIVIKHWRMNNYLRNDRYRPTDYSEEMAQLSVKENGSYSLGIPTVYQRYTNGIPSIDKNSKEKDREEKHRYGEYAHVLLTDKQYQKLVNEYGESKTGEYIKFLDEYIQLKGYKAQDHNLAIRKWVIEATEKELARKNKVDTLPTYDTSRNAEVNEERLNELLARRKK